MTRFLTLITIAVLMISAGCSQATRYTRGPQPLAAAPEPDWKMVSPSLAVEEFNSSPAVQITGILKEIREVSGSGRTLRFTLSDVRFGFGDRVDEASFDLLLWGPGNPELKTGDQISVVMNRLHPRELLVSDSLGPVIRAFSGEVFPPADGTNPLHLSALSDAAYSEVILSPLLCNQTWIHSRIAVTTDRDRVLMRPGESVDVMGNHAGMSTTWRVSTADSSFLDESSCSEDIEPAAWFVWVRTATTGPATEDPFKKIRK